MFDRTRFPGQITCLINPRAANSQWVRKRKLRNYLQAKLPGDIHDVFGGVRTTVERAREIGRDSDILVAVGGDGTIADTLQGLHEAGRLSSIVLGIIPFGSGNAFRNAFGIPKNPRRAVDSLAFGVVRKVDLIELEGRCFGFGSVGATAAATEEKHLRNVHGAWDHRRVARRLLSYPREPKTVELIDGVDDRGERFERRTVESRFFDCVIAKTNYYGYGWFMSPQARLDDGYLDVTLYEMTSGQYTRVFPLIFFGRYQKRLPHFKARRVIITGPDLPVQYHGEYLGVRDKVEFRVLPKALSVICPATKRGQRFFAR
ncbi:MAG: diacylglycerol kinase family protein [Candidatus Aminicenantes bacterium]|nr:diacylglycerol kinase family protein [Candidatus Aminicenantes bacterium]